MVFQQWPRQRVSLDFVSSARYYLAVSCNFSSVLCTAIRSLAPRLVGRKLSSLTSNMGDIQRKMVSGQIRFMSPERGVLQLATCAVLNAIWDLWAKSEGKPLWRLVCDLSPEETVRCIDFRYLTDALTRQEALQMLKRLEASKADRLKLALQNKAVPAYNTSAGWLGHSDDKVHCGLLSARHKGRQFDVTGRFANFSSQRRPKVSNTSS